MKESCQLANRLPVSSAPTWACLATNTFAEPDRTADAPFVLIVDDEPAVRTLLALGLEQAGFLVRSVGSGAEAITVFADAWAEIDLVLLDVNMPGMDGPTTLAALRGYDPNVRCCFMSGYTGRYSPDDLTRMGGRCLVSKPFRLEEIASTLRGLLETDPAG